MTYEEYLQHDATSLAHLVAKGEITPSELTSAALARADEVNSRINAIVHRYDDLSASTAQLSYISN